MVVKYPFITKSGLTLRATSGLHADRKSNPSIGDGYTSVDTLRTYVCLVSGKWTLIDSPTYDTYFNHNGSVDNVMKATITGNGSYSIDSDYHYITLSSGSGVVGTSIYSQARGYHQLNNEGRTITANFVVHNMTDGNPDGRYSSVGFCGNFASPAINDSITFDWLYDGTWQCRTRSGSSETTTTLASVDYPANADMISILATQYIVLFFHSGSIVATHTTNIPITSLNFGACSISDASGTASRELAIDNLGWYTVVE